MSTFVINGGHTLAGSIDVNGSKNAALPLITASLLTKHPVTLRNVPAILDVDKLLTILQSLGVTVDRHDTTVTLTAADIDTTKLSHDLVGHLRGSILLLGALLARYRTASLPLPGGDIIGARPIDVHLDAFRQLGAVVTKDQGLISIDGSRLKAGRVVLREFSVTATENVLLVAASLTGTTTIEIAAAEPHVEALANLLNAMGARISGAGTHTITVEGNPKLSGADVTNISDMLEAGLFILLAAATKSPITITNVPTAHLELFFKKLDDMGVDYTIDGTTVHVRPSIIKPFRVQTLIHPGIATDLQAPFAVLATQATGATLIHDPMYESRFRHCDELTKMGANITVCDPHRVIVQGPTPLHGTHIKSLDIRSGATLVMAALIAEGETVIDDADIIDRGYANLTERLQTLGADINRRNDHESANTRSGSVRALSSRN